MGGSWARGGQGSALLLCAGDSGPVWVMREVQVLEAEPAPPQGDGGGEVF